MYLILCGDLKQDQQEKSLLKSTITYFGKQLTNMIYTNNQNNHQGRPHQDDQNDVFEHGSEEDDHTNDHSRDELHPYSAYKSSFNPPASNGPQQFLSLLKSGEDILRLPRKR